MNEDDLLFFNNTRNEASNWLHSDTQHSLDSCKEWYKKNIQSHYYIIENCGTQIGYFRFSNVKNNSLYIGADLNKEYRGKGYAKKSYQKMFNILRDSGYNTLYLEVLEFNIRAINLYKSLGFTKTESIEIIRNGKKINSFKMIREI